MTKKSKSKEGLLLKLFISFLIIFLLVGFIHEIFFNPEPTTEFYNNQEKGFSIIKPIDWTIKDVKEDSTIYFSDPNDYAYYRVYTFQLEESELINNSVYNSFILLTENFIKQKHYNPSFKDNTLSLNVNGDYININSREITYSLLSKEEKYRYTNEIAVNCTNNIFVHDDKIYGIEYCYNIKYSLKKSLKNIKIINDSFKLLS